MKNSLVRSFVIRFSEFVEEVDMPLNKGLGTYDSSANHKLSHIINHISNNTGAWILANYRANSPSNSFV